MYKPRVDTVIREMSFQELIEIASNKKPGQLMVKVEVKGKSLILPLSFLEYIMANKKFEVGSNYTIGGNTNGVGVIAASYAIPEGLHQIYDIFASYTCDVNVANRTCNIIIIPTPDYNVMTAFPLVSMIVLPTVALTASQNGSLWAGPGQFVQVNTNGVCTDEANGENPCPNLKLPYGSTINSEITVNPQVADLMGVTVIHKRIG